MNANERQSNSHSRLFASISGFTHLILISAFQLFAPHLSAQPQGHIAAGQITFPATFTFTPPTNAVNNATNAPQIYVMTNNFIDPSLGPRLLRNFSAPTTFTIGKFAPGGYVSFYFRNVNRTPMTWPAGITWLSPPPTNQVRGVVFFENVAGEIWATQ